MKNGILGAGQVSGISTPCAEGWNRRKFVKSGAALAAMFGYDLRHAAADTPPETTKIRLLHAPNYCLAPQYIAEEFLRLEGFTEIEYVPETGNTFVGSVVTGHVDFTMDTVPELLPAMDAGLPLLALAGIHTGCYELFGNEHTHSIRDLKGKKVAVLGIGAGDQVFIASMAAYVGLDPTKDIDWVDAHSFADSMRLFVERKVDAFLAFPPQPQELRAKRIGRVIVDTVEDRPWSQYFCCMVAGNRDFIQKNPVATKRALRAYLKAADICAQDPERVARYFVTKGIEPRYEMSLEVIKRLPYNRWRETNPEDTIRFHALRLHEVGMIKSTPQKLIAQGTDWRFLNELKREMKA
jgi:NitT/TauT family transport system substrate-binding protein